MIFVTLNSARFNAAVGLYAEEKPLRNEIEIDIEVSQQANAGELPLIDYTFLYDIARDAATRPVALLENIAEKIIADIKAVYGGAAIDVRVRKLNPPMGGQVRYAEVRLLQKGDS